MKHKNKFLIIAGLVAALMWSPQVHADFCAPTVKNSEYKQAYCNMNPQTNSDVNSKVLETVSKQYDLKTEWIEQILDDSICEIMEEASESEKASYPEEIKRACANEETNQANQLLSQNLFLDVRNSFNKEKAIYFNKLSLQSKFKASEKYWDGKIGLIDAPFDLMVDLNLIEQVLFGSQAKWTNDVYEFPKEENEEEDEEIPLGDLLDQDPQNENQDNSQDQTPDCVPPDHPDADPNAISLNPLCGNGNLDVLLGESCDDGNQNSGDGCNQFCQKELTGSGNLCQDPEAITFKTASQISGGQGNLQNQGDSNNQTTQCPLGYVPKKDNGLTANDTPQSEDYPGPSIGGTLKQFPESERPLCGPGTSPIEITVAGKTQVATNSNGDPRCLPTEFCGNFYAAREHLFGANWEENTLAASIEAMVCVNVIKNDRPLTPYNRIEGCIDCHIRSMVDSLEKALLTNVTPLENTTSAFGLSSRFGPNMSFNLITAVKPHLKFVESDTAPKAVEEGSQSITEKIQQADRPSPTIPSPNTGLNQVEVEQAQAAEELEEIKESIEIYTLGSGMISDFETSDRILPLINQMSQSFESMQSMYQDISNIKLSDTPECKI